MEEKLWINEESGIERFSGYAALYYKYINKFLTYDYFDEYVSAMKAEDYETAFRAAHTLKGAVGNLSLDVLYDKVCESVEYLRNNKDINAAQNALPSLIECYNSTLEKIKEYIQNK